MSWKSSIITIKPGKVMTSKNDRKMIVKDREVTSINTKV